MSSAPPVDFVVDDTVHPHPTSAVVAALGGHEAGEYRMRSVWLDTHDWLLYRAGCLLEHRRAPGGPWLVLTQADGRTVQQQAPRTVPTAHTLPDGAIAVRVHSVIGIRALLPQLEANVHVRVVALTDDLGGTVARVVVDGRCEVGGGKYVPVRARVEPLPGREEAAHRAVERLAGLKGVSRAGPRFAALCAAAGVDPTAHRTKPELAFVADQPAGEAFADAFAALLAILRDNLDGTLAQTDTEFLHDFRVTVRRTRAVLKFADGVINEARRAHLAAELKWLGEQTSRSRDLDVHLLGYDDLAARVADPASLLPFKQQLVEQCRSAHTGLNRALRSERFTTLLADWGRDLAGPQSGPLTGDPVRAIADQRLVKAWRRVHKRGRAVTEASPPEVLHDLRKRCKELRYLLELFASLYDQRTTRRLVKELKRLQNNLGAFQDHRAQAEFLLEHADALGRRGVPAHTLSSLEHLEHQHEEGRRRARAEFNDRWRDFDTGRNQHLFDRLVAD